MKILNSTIFLLLINLCFGQTDLVDSIGVNFYKPSIKLNLEKWQELGGDAIEHFNKNLEYSLIKSINKNDHHILFIEKKSSDEIIHWICIKLDNKIIDWTQSAYWNSEGFLTIYSHNWVTNPYPEI